MGFVKYKLNNAQLYMLHGKLMFFFFWIVTTAALSCIAFVQLFFLWWCFLAALLVLWEEISPVDISIVIIYFPRQRSVKGKKSYLSPIHYATNCIGPFPLAVCALTRRTSKMIKWSFAGAHKHCVISKWAQSCFRPPQRHKQVAMQWTTKYP